ncbi:MAG: hypothetical protein ACRDTM_15140, partial [Micromonosporaceae bacterium]
IDSDPQLASDPRTDTAAIHLVYAGGGWTVVGSAQLDGRVAKTPMAWTSSDGATWRRQQVPYGDSYEDLQRVAGYGDGLVAVGLRGNAYGVWHRTGDRWRRGATFGGFDSDGKAAPFVSGLAVWQRGLVVGVSDSAKHRLWHSPDGTSWREVTPPAKVGVGGEKVMSMATAGSTLVLLTDNADGSTVWLTDQLR